MHPDTYKRPLLITLIVLILGLCFFYQPAPGKHDIFHAISKEEVTLTGRVESFAVIKKDSQNVIIRVFTLNGEPAAGRVYARFKGQAPQFKETVSLRGVLQVPYSVDLPGHFNWRRHLAQKSVFTEIKSNAFVPVHPANGLWRLVRSLRRSILNTFEQSFPPDIAGIAGGILLGERGEISAGLYTAFQDSGAIHLLVASGGNVGFVTLITLLLGSWLGLSRRPLLVIALVTAGLYTLVAGADAPLVRAYLMAVGACAGYFLGRNSGVFQGLLIACFVILVFNPVSVLDTGFQMSFLATAAIIICLTNYRPPVHWPRWVRFFSQIFLATLASQLVLLPVFANVFYKVSLTGLISNMMLVPFASLLMTLTFLYYLTSQLHAGIIFYFPCLGGLELFKTLVEFFASFQASAIAVTAWNAGTVCAYYSMLFLFFHLPQKKFVRKWMIPCLLLAGISLAAGCWMRTQSRVYLLSEWDHRAVIVRLPKQTFVFTHTLDGEKISHALTALGIKKAVAVFSLSGEKERRADVLYPFEDIWPDEEMRFGNVRVRGVWEIHQNKEGVIWQEPGYSGRKQEGISYCMETEKNTLCVGEHARFIQLNTSRVINGKTNQVVKVRL